MRRWICLLLCLLCASCSARAEAKRYETSFLDVFDTYTTLTVYAEDKAFAQSAMQRAHDLLREYHRLYDIYNEYEGLVNLKSVNDEAWTTPVRVDARVVELLLFAKKMYALTDGRMNIAMGSVLRLWHDCRDAGLDDPEHARLPDGDALREAARHTDIDGAIVDSTASTVAFADPALRLDVGAVAKGYATERVAEALEAMGVTSALLSVGGNVRAIGARGDGSAWRVGIQNPDLLAADQTLTTVGLRDRSLVTSGSYQRYYTVDGKRYHHIIDPDTLYPAQYFWAVSVIADDSGLADALSTALFNLPLADGQALLDRVGSAEALWVALDGTVTQSDGWE